MIFARFDVIGSSTERGTTEECVADFRGWHPDVQLIARNIDVPYKWALLGREPLSRFVQGRVCLIGDAAHPMLPFLAQGAVLALEDAAVVGGGDAHAAVAHADHGGAARRALDGEVDGLAEAVLDGVP